MACAIRTALHCIVPIKGKGFFEWAYESNSQHCWLFVLVKLFHVNEGIFLLWAGGCCQAT